MKNEEIDEQKEANVLKELERLEQQLEELEMDIVTGKIKEKVMKKQFEKWRDLGLHEKLKNDRHFQFRLSLVKARRKTTH